MKVSMTKIILYIQDRIRVQKRVTVNEVCAQFKVSRHWLVEHFQQRMQIAPHNYIKQKELRYWEQLLKENHNEQLKNLIPDLGIPKSTFYRRRHRYSTHVEFKKYSGSNRISKKVSLSLRNI